MDSSQANFRSVDGSVATFDLPGGDIDIPHAETHTAVVSLEEFFAANTIYNIDNTCNTLEQYIQYCDVSGNPTSGIQFIITIPNGSYNITQLINMINQKFFENYYNASGQYITTSSTPIRGFGYFYSTNTTVGSTPTNPIQAACGLDSVNYSYQNTSATSTRVQGPQNKIRFWTPTLQFMNNYTNITVGGTRIYECVKGIYLVSNNYPGLLNRLGFTTSKAYNISLPSYKYISDTVKGFGITFTLTQGVDVILGGTDVYVQYDIDKTLSPFAQTEIAPFQNGNTMNNPPSSGIYYKTNRTAFALIAPDWVNLDYPRNIYMSIDSITTRNRCACPKLPYGSVFHKIPNYQSTTGALGNFFGNYILYQPIIPSEVYAPGLNLDSITIRLFDDNGNPINWNGGSWTVVVAVKYSVDVGSAGMEDVTLGRNYRPYLQQTQHDPLHTRKEFNRKRSLH